MPYEDGMSISYDELTGTVTVCFRGIKVVLPQGYTSRVEGIAAGEDWCRKYGWSG